MYHNIVETKKLFLNVHINFLPQIGLLIRYPTQTSNQEYIQSLFNYVLFHPFNVLFNTKCILLIDNFKFTF
jgi:hypothetical protein